MRARAAVAVVSLVAGICVFVVAPPASAGVVINVPASYATIQAGIDAAAAGDSVVVAPGTYFEHIDFKGKAIEVKSSAGPATTIIDGGGTDRVVTFKTGEARISVLRGFTLTHGGTVSTGLGVLVQHASPTIVGNVVTGNAWEAGSGAGLGIYVEAGSPLIEANQIVDNPGGSIGGGIYSDRDSDPEIVANLIQGHSASFGAGVHISGGTLRNNVIRGNHAGSFAGGVGADRAVSLVNNLIVDNTAVNIAGGVGWAAVVSGKTATFVNNTIAGNSAPSAAALAVGSAGLTLVNNLLVSSTGGNVVKCLNDAPGATAFSHNDVYDLSWDSLTKSPYEGCADPTGTDSNLSVDPSFAPDYRLRPGSLAIDAGRQSGVALPPTDAFGGPRVIDGNGDGSAVVDMGAIESPARPVGVVINVPASKATIQAAIDAASEGDTVVVAPGSYHERIDFKGKGIEVRSSGGPAATTIDGGGLVNVVTFGTFETRAAVLRGFTVTGGVGSVYGIGILIYRSSPTVVGNVITGNQGPNGSGAGIGIASRDGFPLIKGNRIVDNPGGTMGGGIYSEYGAPDIVGNVIEGNSGHWGGGLTIDRGTVQGNVIRDNHGGYGGGIFAFQGAVLTNNLIVGNSAEHSGGGVEWDGFQGTPSSFVNNTIAGNEAPAGAALAITEAGLTLTNNVLSGPTGTTAVSCAQSAASTVFDHNDVYNSTPAPSAGCANATDTNGNISADPMFDAEYRLVAGSPAIDAGRAGASVPSTDQAGNPRPTDGDGDGVPVVDMGAYEAPAIPVPTYHPLTPARMLDTRTGNGAPVGKVGPEGFVALQVTGRGGVPATGVSAVVLNVTVTEPTAVSFLTAWPAGSDRPLASNLNYAAGQTVANLVTVKVGTDGKVYLLNYAGTAHVIADVAGWYGANGDRYNGLSPARILDTRNGAGPLAAGTPRTLQVTGQGGVPATGVSAVILNLTVTNTGAGGWLAAWPAGEALPLVSNLNFVAGQTVPNLAVVKVGAGGAVNLYSSGGPVDVIADVAGYFSTAGAGFSSLPPARILDTRTGGGALSPGVPRSLQVTGRGGVPATGVSAVVLNVTVTEPASDGWLAAWPAGEPLPLASNLNYVAGQTVPNLVVVKVGAGGKVNLYSSGGPVHVIADVAGWFTG